MNNSNSHPLYTCYDFSSFPVLLSALKMLCSSPCRHLSQLFSTLMCLSRVNVSQSFRNKKEGLLTARLTYLPAWMSRRKTRKTAEMGDNMARSRAFWAVWNGSKRAGQGDQWKLSVDRQLRNAALRIQVVLWLMTHLVPKNGVESQNVLTWKQFSSWDQYYKLYRQLIKQHWCI